MQDEELQMKAAKGSFLVSASKFVNGKLVEARTPLQAKYPEGNDGSNLLQRGRGRGGGLDEEEAAQGGGGGERNRKAEPPEEAVEGKESDADQKLDSSSSSYSSLLFSSSSSVSPPSGHMERQMSLWSSGEADVQLPSAPLHVARRFKRTNTNRHTSCEALLHSKSNSKLALIEDMGVLDNTAAKEGEGKESSGDGSCSSRKGFISLLPPRDLSTFLAELPVELAQSSSVLPPLTDSLAVAILSHLRPSDLCRMEQVAKSWRALASHDSLWRNFATEGMQRQRPPAPGGWKQVFKQACMCKHCLPA